MTTLAAPLLLFVLALATPARAQNVNPPDFCPQAAALVRYFADARDQGELEVSAQLHLINVRRVYTM